VDATLALYRDLRERFHGRGAYDFGERSLNDFGYSLIEESPDDAVAVFHLNAEQFPESANVWDSLAEAYMAAGDRERAIEHYEKALELDPENENAREKLRDLRGE
ncbi:MAG TPA: tetratricopeptide repeat protein, partial [Candidatus Limnocylindrales bacterium]|nr:tetratricopeptide repeat protein [Candidatus Limnocylindrales bacterium]